MEICLRSRCAGIRWWLKELWQFTCGLGVLEFFPLMWSCLKAKFNVVIKMHSTHVGVLELGDWQ